ncbi:MAG: SprT family zinc-dependent metalloprotease [Candidatus Gracilibacteria bacterium]
MKIDETGKLIIKAPYFVNKKTINDFVDKNASWVEERKNNLLKRLKNYKEGEKFYFFGDEYELKFDDVNENIYFDGRNFHLHKKNKKIVKEKLIIFYKLEARKYIEKKVLEIAEKNKLKFDTLKITSAKTRWGSCTSKQNVNFTFRLIQAPIKTIDYVIIHELAHLKEMNHSKKFWDLVDTMSKKLYPGDYKIHKKWLNDNGDKLMY